jgi:hypothetical protein
LLYTNEEIQNIKEAYYLLERIFESRDDAEDTLRKAYKYEYRSRGNQWNAQALIIREVYNRNKIKKHHLFTTSEGIMNCVIAAYCVFYDPDLMTKEKINKFNKAARKAIKAHDDAITRNLDAVCSR